MMYEALLSYEVEGLIQIQNDKFIFFMLDFHGNFETRCTARCVRH